jgi:hypothetical protein
MSAGASDLEMGSVVLALWRWPMLSADILVAEYGCLCESCLEQCGGILRLVLPNCKGAARPDALVAVHESAGGPSCHCTAWL